MCQNYQIIPGQFEGCDTTTNEIDRCEKHCKHCFDGGNKLRVGL